MYSRIYCHHCVGLKGCHNNPVCNNIVYKENITDTLRGSGEIGENFLLMKVYIHTVTGPALMFQHSVLKSLGMRLFCCNFGCLTGDCEFLKLAIAKKI